MKRKGHHPNRVLTTVKVKSLKEPGRYADGSGLYLIVEPSGAKRWMLRVMAQGRRRDIGLGGVQFVSLAEAREKAINLTKIAKAGGDPVTERKAKAGVPTFAEAARSVHAEHAAAWRNEKHTDQWINTLVTYVFPTLGERRVDQIDTPDVLKVLSPIWLKKPETARRVKQRIGTVLDWAKAAGFRSGDNIVHGVSKGLPRQPERRRHHATLPYAEVPAFVRTLRASDSNEPTKLAFEFLILTAARTNEVLQALWSEVEDGVWTIPAERMKARREHRVPLSPRCLAILRRATQLSDGGEYVFCGRSAEKTLSNMALLMVLRRMDLDVTVHGFRSAFRDWAAECTNFTREVCEMALAHTIKDKAEAAYRRGDLLEKRRELMAAWVSTAE
ncbi:MAG: integrase arm-type DNA-binding domain-containing protein [Hyphomicrobium sp.]|nr:integrase arm-type DNA-binding domain-containing protein [Hyphomicrobium sp.]